jgi:hypothetical protein
MIRIGCRIRQRRDWYRRTRGGEDATVRDLAQLASHLFLPIGVRMGECLNGENEDDEVRTTASTRTRLSLVVSLHRIPFYRNPSTVI